MTRPDAAALAKARDVAKEIGFAYAGDDQDAAVAIIARAILEAMAAQAYQDYLTTLAHSTPHNMVKAIRARADELEAMAKEIEG